VIKFKSGNVLELLLIALLYVVAARVGQIFALPPGNITPVWLPSGLMLAAALLRGQQIWPGIFIGAAIVRGWAYADFSSLTDALMSVFSASAYGFGEVLCTLIAFRVLGRRRDSTELFVHLSVFRQFLVYGVIAGPLISAVIGVFTLAISGQLPLDLVAVSLLNRWVGAGVGVLLLTPTVLSLHSSDPWIPPGRLGFELFCFAILGILLPTLDSILIALIGYPVNAVYLAVPLLLWSVVRLGIRPTLLAAVYFTAIELSLNLFGQGAFHLESQALSVLSFQVYVVATVAPILVVASLLMGKASIMARLEDEVTHDALTHAFNRQYLDQQLQLEVSRQFRYKSPFSLLMLDIDHFKQINDTHGHLAGDRVLKELVRVVDAEIRENDVMARWGGEEFIILMPETNAQGAALFAERIRQQVADTRFLPDKQVHISIGVIEYRTGTPIDDIMGELDVALYRAKRDGRNLVRVAGEPSHLV